MSLSTLQTLDISKLSKDHIARIFHEIDTIICDCDGVLWLDNNSIQGSVEVTKRFKELGKKVILLTNNSTKERVYFFLKARKMGYDVEMEDIVSTAHLVALYLKNNNFKEKAYVIGSKGIITELESIGIKHLGYGPDNLQHSLVQTIEHFSPDPNVGAVIVGFDEYFCYTKLLKAASYLNKASCLFLATNVDESFPINSSLVLPGTGSILRSVEAVAQREAILVGKPHPFVGEALKKKFNVVPERTLLIGDRCNSDIELGAKCGYQTLLVLSGAPTFITKKTAPYKESHIPDYYIQSLGALLPHLP